MGSADKSKSAASQDPERVGESPALAATECKDVASAHDAPHDAVFGEITEDGPNYRSVRALREPSRCSRH